MRGAVVVVVFSMLWRGTVASAAVLPISPIITDPASGHRFQLLSNATWADSEAEAVALGGHLATIDSQETQNFVLNTFGAYSGFQHILWIGLYDPTQQTNPSDPAANYVWVDGSPITYTNWDPGEPNNAFGTEFWVAMYYPNFHNPGSWNDWSVQKTDPIGIPFYGVVEYVPEPSAAWLATIGLAGFAVWLKRRNLSGTATIVVLEGLGHGGQELYQSEPLVNFLLRK